MANAGGGGIHVKNRCDTNLFLNLLLTYLNLTNHTFIKLSIDKKQTDFNTKTGSTKNMVYI